MAQIGNITFQTSSYGEVKLPVYSLGDSGSEVGEFLRVQTPSGEGFVPVVSNSGDATYSFLRVQSSSNGVMYAHDETSLNKIWMYDFEDGTTQGFEVTSNDFTGSLSAVLNGAITGVYSLTCTTTGDSSNDSVDLKRTLDSPVKPASISWQVKIEDEPGSERLRMYLSDGSSTSRIVNVTLVMVDNTIDITYGGTFREQVGNWSTGDVIRTELTNIDWSANTMDLEIFKNGSSYVTKNGISMDDSPSNFQRWRFLHFEGDTGNTVKYRLDELKYRPFANPSFENDHYTHPDSGFTVAGGWRYYDSHNTSAQAGEFSVYDSWSSNGSWSIRNGWRTNNGGGEENRIEQDVELTGVGTVKVDRRGFGNATRSELRIRVDGSLHANLGTFPSDGTSDTVSFDLSSYSGVHTVAFVWYQVSGDNLGTSAIDNIRMV